MSFSSTLDKELIPSTYTCVARFIRAVIPNIGEFLGEAFFFLLADILICIFTFLKRTNTPSVQSVACSLDTHCTFTVQLTLRVSCGAKEF